MNDTRNMASDKSAAKESRVASRADESRVAIWLPEKTVERIAGMTSLGAHAYINSHLTPDIMRACEEALKLPPVDRCPKCKEAIWGELCSWECPMDGNHGTATRAEGSKETTGTPRTGEAESPKTEPQDLR